MQRSFIFLLFLSGLSAPSLWGQKDDVPSEQLPEAQVSDYRIEPDATFKQERINTDSLRQISRLTLAEALRQNTGIFVRSYGGNGVATLSMRGSGASHVNIFWNNLDVGSPTLGLTDLSTIPLQSFDQLDLQYGFGGLIDGSGALGGTMRLKNRPSWIDGHRLSVQQEASSLNNYQTALRYGYGKGRWQSETSAYWYKAANNFTYPDITRSERPQEQMRNNDLEQRGATQNIYYRPGKNKLLSLKAWYNEVDRKLPPPITGNPENFDRLLDRSVAAIAEYSTEGENHHWLINSGIVSASNEFTSGGDSTSNPNNFTSWQNNLRYRRQHNDWLRSENGASFRWEMASSQSFTDRVQRQRASVFSQWQARLGERWGSSLLLRQEWITGNFSPLLGSLGFYYRPHDKQKWRINLARNFRFPSLNDLHWNPGGNLDLEPEKSWNLESGYEWSQLSFAESAYQSKLSLTGFYNLVDNWIQWSPSGNVWAPQNLKEVENLGVELSSTGAYQGDRWSLGHSLSYTYTRSITTDVYTEESNTVGKNLPYVPNHKLVLGGAVGFRKWELRYSHTITSRYYTSADNQVYMPAYTVGRASLMHRNVLKSNQHQLSAALTVHNVADMPYQILPFRPEPGIHIMGTLSYQLR